MKVTKRQLKRIIAEEREKLLKESVSDMTSLDDQISSAAFGVATVFSELLFPLKDEMPPGDISPTWDDEVDAAESALMDKLRADITKTVEEFETRLHNGDFYRG